MELILRKCHGLLYTSLDILMRKATIHFRLRYLHIISSLNNLFGYGHILEFIHIIVYKAFIKQIFVLTTNQKI